MWVGGFVGGAEGPDVVDGGYMGGGFEVGCKGCFVVEAGWGCVSTLLPCYFVGRILRDDDLTRLDEKKEKSMFFEV